ncbi:hypothetical protein HU200_039934 [Digitaria exilis]|uniref:Protein kinase domain-containing protein n=1 Tax=Digitaria exilis TaxID=1010633 RepID=A0A835EKH2_9POAL|nr:hypothetical protein HU200_039934 [Digitaria exilis]
MMTLEFNEQKFKNTIKNMRLCQHENIVQFLGYCYYSEVEALEYRKKLVMAEKQERLLCFQYLSNGSLDLYVSGASSGLEWRERYQIIMGLCKGLHYIHGNNIIHMDLKPRHILLDDNMVPKISGFHLSKGFAEDQSQTLRQSSVMGTVGYIAPELKDRTAVSFKSDIYSLGVTITEILTGEKETCDTEKVVESWRTRLGTSCTDELLEQVRVCAEISIVCRDPNPEKRPDMKRVIEMLGETDC